MGFQKNILVSALFAITLIASANSDANGSHHRSIVGSWDATVDFFGTPFRLLYSFQRGGTLTESDYTGFDPNFGDNALSPGLGQWQRAPRRSYTAKYRKLAYNNIAELQLVVTSRLIANVEHDGTLDGTLEIEVALPDGTVVNQFPPLSFTGERIAP